MNLTFIKYSYNRLAFNKHYGRRTWFLIRINDTHLEICRYLAIQGTWLESLDLTFTLKTLFSEITYYFSMIILTLLDLE